ncbi:MAG: hypothetical protein M3422_07460 [Actinomycetota bacterium]|nr:hypothetical protein [Actinomycetota bacterium]
MTTSTIGSADPVGVVGEGLADAADVAVWVEVAVRLPELEVLGDRGRDVRGGLGGGHLVEHGRVGAQPLRRLLVGHGSPTVRERVASLLVGVHQARLFLRVLVPWVVFDGQRRKAVRVGVPGELDLRAAVVGFQEDADPPGDGEADHDRLFDTGSDLVRPRDAVGVWVHQDSGERGPEAQVGQYFLSYRVVGFVAGGFVFAVWGMGDRHVSSLVCLR